MVYNQDLSRFVADVTKVVAEELVVLWLVEIAVSTWICGMAREVTTELKVVDTKDWEISLVNRCASTARICIYFQVRLYRA